MRNDLFGTLLFGFLLVLFVNGCGETEHATVSGGGGSSSSSAIGAIDMATLFPNVDEQALVDNPPNDTLQTTASEGKAELVPVDGSVQIAQGLIGGVSADGKTLTIDASAVSDSDVGKPLFVDHAFKGVIASVSGGGSSKHVAVEEAQYVTDVYKHFELVFKNDGLKAALRRALEHAIAQGELAGRYDALNAQPLKLSLVRRPQARSTDGLVNELVLRIDIPEGYRIPVEPRAVECSFTEASCSFTSVFATKRKTDLGFQYNKDYITVDSAGSFIEIGIGSYLNVYYDYNVASDNVFRLKAGQSAYFKSSLSIKVSANIAEIVKENGLKWEKEIKLLSDFNVLIPNPAGAGVQTWLAISPNFTIGFEGKLSGAVTYRHTVERRGEIRVNFDSTTDTHAFYSNASDSAEKLTQDNVIGGIEAEARFYLFPNLTFVPSLTFFMIHRHVTLVALQSGVNMDNTLAGKIEYGFVAENKQKYSAGPGTEARLTSTLYGLIRGKWMVDIGSVKLYEPDEGYENILEFPKNKLFEWKVQLLNAPKLVIKDSPGVENSKLVYFGSDDDKLLGHLYFYYNVGDTVEGTPDVPVLNIEQHAKVWRLGDTPLRIEGNKIIKARAVLLNQDVSDSVWSWGTSVSAQNVLAVASIAAPQISPTPQAFSDALTVTLSQSQGYDIYYKIDGGAVQKYSGPFSVNDTATVTAYSEVDFDGQKIRSERVRATYEKCGDGQKIENGTCVAKTCRDDGYACPVCGSGETLAFNDDGSGYCSGDHNGTSGGFDGENPVYGTPAWTFADWSNDCPEGMQKRASHFSTVDIDYCEQDGWKYLLRFVEYTDASKQQIFQRQYCLAVPELHSGFNDDVTGFSSCENRGAMVLSERMYAGGTQHVSRFGFIKNDSGRWNRVAVVFEEKDANRNVTRRNVYDTVKKRDGAWQEVLKSEESFNACVEYLDNAPTESCEIDGGYAIREYAARADDGDNAFEPLLEHYVLKQADGRKVEEGFYAVKKNPADGKWRKITTRYETWWLNGNSKSVRLSNPVLNDAGVWEEGAVSYSCWEENGTPCAQ